MDPLDTPIGGRRTCWELMLCLDSRDNSQDIHVATIIGVRHVEETLEHQRWLAIARALEGEIVVISSSLLESTRRHDRGDTPYPIITYDMAHKHIWGALRRRGDVLKRRRKGQHRGDR